MNNYGIKGYILKLQTENIHTIYRKSYVQYIQYTATISLDCVKPSFEYHMQTHEGLPALTLP